MKSAVWILAAVIAAAAGVTDWRSRRIPNWITVPGLFAGLLLNFYVYGLAGVEQSLLGIALGLALLFPFLWIRALGAGDWKLMGAIGAVVGPHHLLIVLLWTVLVNGAMAAAMILWKKRVRQTAYNLGHMLASIFAFQLPGREFTIDNPESIKVPFGVAATIAVVLYSARQLWMMRLAA